MAAVLRVLTVERNGTLRFWDAASEVAAGMPLKLTSAMLDAAQFSPDGRSIATICLSPDGRWLSTAEWSDAANVWDAATGQRVGFTLRHRGGVRQSEV